MKNKMLSFLLSAICACALMVAVSPSACADVVTEGSCGEQLTWHYDDATQTLTVSGQGQMNTGDYPQWSDLRQSVVKIVIGDGVTSISDQAFFGFSNLYSVDLPGSMQIIGRHAFDSCIRLENISLNYGITVIGDSAFCRTSIRTLNLPATVTRIGHGAFQFCGQLNSVTFNGAITTIDSYAFNACASLTSINIPDSVTGLGSSAFSYCQNLSAVTIGSGVTELKDNVFAGCTSLSGIVIPNNVRTIEAYAFSNCSSLTDISLGTGVSDISCTAFWGCTKLSAFSVAGGNNSFSTDRGVLYNKNKTCLVTMPQGFSGTYQVLPGTTRIAEYACYECVNLIGISIPGGVSKIEQYTFSGCRSLNYVTLSRGVSRIELYAFSRCPSLQQLILPSSITYLGQMFIAGSSSSIVITFTGNAPEFSDAAFGSASPLVYFPDNNPTWDHVPTLYGGVPTWEPLSCNGNHQEVTDDAVPATCTENGLSQGSHCSKCGEVITAQKTVPSTGHSYGDWVVLTAATEKAEGLAERTCSTCSETEQKVLAKLNTPSDKNPPSSQPTPQTTPEQPSFPVTGDPSQDVTASDTPSTESSPDEQTPPADGEDADPSYTPVIIIAAAVIVLLGATATVLILIKRRTIS